jgi:hypothetical protein
MTAILLLAFSVLSFSAITKIKYTGRTTALTPVGGFWTFATTAVTADDIANLCKLSTTNAKTGHTMSTAKADNLLSEFIGFDNSDTIEFTGTNIESITITLTKDLHYDIPVSFVVEVTCPANIGGYTLEINNGTAVVQAKAAAAFEDHQT